MSAPLLHCHTPHQSQLLTALRDKNGLKRDFTRFAKFGMTEGKYRNLGEKLDLPTGHHLWEK
jgi:hypothetical protein